MFKVKRNIKNIRELIKFIFWKLSILANNSKYINGKNNIIDISDKTILPKLKNIILKIKGNNNKIIIKSGVSIVNTKIEIHGNGHQLVIEDNCRIQGSYLWMEDSDCQLKIGKGTSFEKEVKICVTEPNSTINIGEDCMFAYGIVIRSGDSHSIIELDSNKRINYAEDINIGNHVWIGTNAQLLKGASIGSNSIIAAGAIVTKSIPENCIATGVPAQVKRTGVKWIREKISKNL